MFCLVSGTGKSQVATNLGNRKSKEGVSNATPSKKQPIAASRLESKTIHLCVSYCLFWVICT